MKNLWMMLVGSFFFGACVPTAPVTSRYQTVKPSIYMVKQGRTGGTGFKVLDASGNPTIVTNSHICALAKHGSLQIQHEADIGPTQGTVIVDVPEHDLCLVAMLDDGRPAMQLARSRPEIGDYVYTQGHGALERQWPRSGVVRGAKQLGLASRNEACDGPNEGRETFSNLFGEVEVCIATFDVIDVAMDIIGGCSGSPLFNDREEVVGVIFAAGPGLAGAIPVERLRALLGY